MAPSGTYEGELLKHYQPVRPNIGDEMVENRGRVSDVHQNESSDDGIEGRAGPEPGEIVNHFKWTPEGIQSLQKPRWPQPGQMRWRSVAWPERVVHHSM